MFGKQSHFLLCLELGGQTLFRGEVNKIQFPLTIGRDASCAWRIPAVDRTASNRHAELFFKKGRLFIRDLGSHNGVLLFDERIKEHSLAVGDSYSIGDCRLMVLEQPKSSNDASKKSYHVFEQLNGTHPKAIELKKSEYIIGSDSQADIVCPDSMVSHKHAKLTIRPDGSCWVCDLGSRNGTLVNQVKLSTELDEGRMLQDGDVVSIVWINYRFCDKNSGNRKSHLVLKSVIALLTAMVLLLGYFLYQSLNKTAKEYLLLAQEYAKAEKFDQALEYLKEAPEARHWDSVRKECSAFERDLEVWKQIRQEWNATDDNLKKGKLTKAGKSLASLLQRQKMWNWNDGSAIQTRTLAINAWKILEPMFYGKDMLKKSTLEQSELEGQITALKKSLESPVEDYPLLTKEANRVCEELIHTRDCLRRMEEIVGGLSCQGDVRELVEELKGMFAEMETHVKKSEASDLASKVPLELCKTYLEPMECFARAQGEYRENLKKASGMLFHQQTKRLNLPSATLCKYSPVFSKVSSQFEILNAQLQQAITGLSQTCEMLSAQGIQIEKAPSAMTTFHSSEFLEKLMAFDCFDAPNWNANRNTPVGFYDSFLGIEVFYRFIRSLPEDFDSGILENTHFTPEIFTLKEQYEIMMTFKKMMDGYDAVPAILEVEVSGPSLQEFFLWVDGLLDARESAVRRCMEYSRKVETTNCRDSIVAGGVALLLKADDYEGFSGDYTRLAKLYKGLRQRLEDSVAGEHSLEGLRQVQEQILAQGLPGDYLVRKILREKTEATHEE